MQRRIISQFYRQIGNAASPPCVAAVAEHAVSSFLISSNDDGEKKYHDVRKSRCGHPVFELILKASPQRQKILGVIDRKFTDFRSKQRCITQPT
jgi:hypothetical protein